MALLRKLSSDERRNIGHWAMELVVVVAGVLIALWLQQWVEQRRAIRGMAAAENAIHDEVRAALITLVWREAINRCHLDRAQLLKSMLLKGGNHWPGITENALLRNDISQVTGVQSVVPGVYQRPNDVLSAAAWNSALTTGALAPMDRKRFDQLVDLYGQIEFLKRNADREDRAAATLSALSLPQELTPETRTRMFQALYEIDTSRFMFIFNGATTFASAMKKLGWNDKAEVDRWIAEDRAGDRERGFQWRPCVGPYNNPFNTN
jgi:hypothetical protein